MVLFQYRYATGYDKFLLSIGVLCAMGTGICQPLNVLIFGTLTGNIIKFATIMLNETLPIEVRETAQENFMQDIISFATYNSMIGVAMLILSYSSTVLFNYSAIRQVGVRCLFNKLNSKTVSRRFTIFAFSIFAML